MNDPRALADRVQSHVLDHPDADPAVVLRGFAPLLPSEERTEILRLVHARREGLGPIDDLLLDPQVSEVMVNGPGRVWVERIGVLEPTEVLLDRSEIELLIERLVVPIGRRVDQRSPCVDGRLTDGSRVNIVVPPIALDGPYVTIRRFVLTEVELGDFGTDAAGELASDIAAHRNMIVSGGTGAGKTTLLNAIASAIRPGERVVTAEDAAELRLPHPHVVRLETRPESAEHVGLITMRDLVRNALRMRPDRLILGEVRGGEAFDLMQALNTGHRGCLSTVHANGAPDALRRLESLAVLGGAGFPLDAVRVQRARAIDVMVHVARDRDGRRAIAAIADVGDDGSIGTRWCTP
ncbi:MAG: ATPase, T2SS/T4P/T4SS family [Actinomycetota bacterium]